MHELADASVTFRLWCLERTLLPGWCMLVQHGLTGWPAGEREMASHSLGQRSQPTQLWCAIKSGAIW